MRRGGWTRRMEGWLDEEGHGYGWLEEEGHGYGWLDEDRNIVAVWSLLGCS